MHPINSKDVNHYFSILTHISSQDMLHINSLNLPFTAPTIPEEDVEKIIHATEYIFKNESILLEVTSPLIIIGDLHGNYFDLIRIFHSEGYPSDDKKYVFLGDVVDHGEFSFETIILVFLFKLIYPHCVYIIRGNHEFHSTAFKHGFYSEINQLYQSDELFQKFITCFSYLPLAALIDKKYFCIHGGIGPDITTLQQIAEIERPILDLKNPIVEQLLWSDPSEEILEFDKPKRIHGCMYGEKVVNQFLEKNSLEAIVRGHECVSNGAKSQLNGKVVTVFSSSNYCGDVHNLGGILFIDHTSMTLKTYQGLNVIKRGNQTSKLNTEPEKAPILRSSLSSSSIDIGAFRLRGSPRKTNLKASSSFSLLMLLGDSKFKSFQ